MHLNQRNPTINDIFNLKHEGADVAARYAEINKNNSYLMDLVMKNPNLHAASVPLSQHRFHVITCLAQPCAGCGKPATKADYQIFASEYQDLASTGQLFNVKWRQQRFWCCMQLEYAPRIQEVICATQEPCTVTNIAPKVGLAKTTCQGFINNGRNKYWRLKGGCVLPLDPEQKTSEVSSKSKKSGERFKISVVSEHKTSDTYPCPLDILPRAVSSTFLTKGGWEKVGPNLLHGG
eukprot:TRINITY_DN703_c0_g2_i1.p2 TRINITY_DN703_c0_g2~~TRINITY_DN703_c0_g2_i1.p2  ORF type:complete len:235 (-),score=28.68 TRINITY_DN703_c0_g2_i1:1214-1918(-)